MQGLVASDMPERTWTRRQVANHLGVSVATVRRMEGQTLHPTADARGVHRFDVVEVQSLRVARGPAPATQRDDAGKVAAKVFEQLRRGANLEEIVITVRVAPKLVRDLYAEWLVSLEDGQELREMEAERAEEERQEREHRARLRALRGRRDSGGSR